MVKSREEDEDSNNDDRDGSIWMLDFNSAGQKKCPEDYQQRANQEEEDGQCNGFVGDPWWASLEL